MKKNKGTGEHVLAYLRDEQGLALDWAIIPDGKFIISLGSLTPDLSKREFVSIFTSNVEFQSIWDVTTYKVDDNITLKATWGGISQLRVFAGDIVYFELAVSKETNEK